MATKTENAEIAVLQTQMEQVIAKQESMEKKQDAHFDVITTKLDALNPIPFTVEDHSNRIKTLEKARSKNWIFNTLSAAFGALFLFLINYAITH